MLYEQYAFIPFVITKKIGWNDSVVGKSLKSFQEYIFKGTSCSFQNAKTSKPNRMISNFDMLLEYDLLLYYLLIDARINVQDLSGWRRLVNKHRRAIHLTFTSNGC